MLRTSVIGLATTVVLTLASPATADPIAPGATVGELIALARRLSPELAAAALSAEAAIPRIASAGALPDPTLRVEADNLDNRNMALNGQTTVSRLMQEFPLWGKLDLKRDIASFEASAANYRRRSAELELIARVKSVFAARYATFQALVLTQRSLDTVRTTTTNVRDRYSQGAGAQEDVLRLEIEAEELNIEIARLRGQMDKTAAQLNALLNRRLTAPLARPVALPPLPSERRLGVENLVDRAIRSNPSIAEGEAKAGSAGAATELAQRNFYPDLSLGLMTTRDRDGYAGTGVMAEVRIPLQWQAKEAEVSAAAAEQAAAHQKLQALKATLAGDLGGLLAEYRAAAKTLRILQQQNLPKSDLIVRSALSALETGQGDAFKVRDAIRRLLSVQLEILKLRVQLQTTLAEIEKAIGGDL
jgi:cobalt-zinc-cadmium efflux system outer membrane protein